MKKILSILLLATSAYATTPNVVVIMLDDVGAYTCNPYGCDTNLTPNIDLIADDGMLFGNFHSYQACAVSKAALLSGREALRTGVTAFADGKNFQDSEITIAKLAQDAGYATGVFAKWNVGNGSEDIPVRTQTERIEYFGFDTNLTFNGPTIVYPVNGDPLNLAQTNYWPYLYNQEAVQFIGDNATNQFLLFYTTGLPHSPFDVETPFDTNTSASVTENYWKKMVYLDWCVSNIIAKIESEGLTSNTVVILTGDNGTPANIDSVFNGVTVAGGKQSVDQTGSWVPMYVKWPGTVATGTTYNAISQLSDIAPTIARIIGVQMPQDRIIDGRSFYDQLLGSTTPHRTIAYLIGSAVDDHAFDENYMSDENNALFSVTNKPFGDDSVSGYSQVDTINSLRLYNSMQNRLNMTDSDRNSWNEYTNTVLLITP